MGEELLKKGDSRGRGSEERKILGRITAGGEGPEWRETQGKKSRVRILRRGIWEKTSLRRILAGGDSKRKEVLVKARFWDTGI